MIRKNYSLADERRKFEKQQQAKIQKRQKRQHRLSKLESVDPSQLYSRLTRLEKRQADSNVNPTQANEFTERDRNYLKTLKEDWDFIVSNGLHKHKVDEILSKANQAERKRIADSTKLWGSKSVYFNPELNPLGKVPPKYPNITKGPNLKTKYDDDPRIIELGVVVPAGEPPKFYKEVFNYEKPLLLTEPEAKTQTNEKKEQRIPSERNAKEFSSDEESYDDGESDNEDNEETMWKKQKSEF